MDATFQPQVDFNFGKWTSIINYSLQYTCLYITNQNITLLIAQVSIQRLLNLGLYFVGRTDGVLKRFVLFMFLFASDLVVVALLALLADEVDVELPRHQAARILILYLELQHCHLKKIIKILITVGFSQ